MNNSENFFQQKLEQIIEKNFLNKENVIIHNNIAVLKFPEFPHQFAIIGCDYCLTNEIIYNNEGIPTLEGKPLISIEKYNNIKEIQDLPIEIKSNIWLCPKCRKIIKELLPNFI